MAAEVGAPLPLAPGVAPGDVAPAAAAPEAAVGPADLTDPTVPRQGIDVDVLGEMGPDDVGVLGPEDGGFGSDLWRGTPRSLVERLLPELPAPIASPAMRELARRLLLLQAEAPAGPFGASLLAMRLERLAALGRDSDLDALLARVSEGAEDAGVARHRIDLRWLAGDLDGGCDMTRKNIPRYDQNPYLQKALIFCQARAGESAPAALGLDLLGEQGHDDPLFAALIGARQGGEPAADAGDGLTALHLAVYDALGRLPKLDATKLAPALLAAVAGRPHADAALRLEAGERAAALGALPVEALQRHYLEVPANARDLDDAIDAGLDSARDRAVLYQAAARALAPEPRARLLAKALAEARVRGAYAQAVALYLPLLMQMAPAPTLAWFAGEAGRALYLAGRYETAGTWLELAQASSDPKAVLAMPSLWTLASLAGGAESIVLDTPTGLGAEPDAGAASRTARLMAVLEAFGASTGDAWAMLDTGGAADLGPMPDARLWFALGQAADARRIGETVLLALVALGPEGPAAANPLVLGRVLDSLRRAGLEEEARALAFEAAIGSGL